MNNNLPFILDFDLVTGMCNSGKAQPTHRTVGNMAAQFQDTEAAKAMADKLHLGSLDFQSLQGVLEAIGIEPCKLCTYCWNGKE